MTYIDDFIALGIISLLGAISPGPDFVIVSQNSLKHGKSAGIFTSLGVTFGCSLHFTYCILGIGIIVAESIILFNVIKYCGAAYLIYLGIKGLRAKPSTATSDLPLYSSHALSNFSAFKKGFLVNILNPKVTLFILSIFTQVIDPHTPILIQFAYALEFCVVCVFWFCLLSYLLSSPFLRHKLLDIQHHIERVLGGILIFLGLKVASSV